MLWRLKYRRYLLYLTDQINLRQGHTVFFLGLLCQEEIQNVAFGVRLEKRNERLASLT